MAADLGLAASNITAALISSDAVSVKGQTSQDTVKQAVRLYSVVLTELMNLSQEGKLYEKL
jgi:hypothetical protein